jgi:hypothetical protein
MPHDKYEWLQRLKAVEREHAAMRRAADRFLAGVRHEPTILRGDVRPRDVEHASDRLEGTYVMRLFAEFETGLRLFWATVRRSHPRTVHLIEGVSALRGVPDDVRERAHAVREYRNGLVHEREGDVVPIPIADARGHLCRFFDRLPATW